jgi:hypothetical protein
VAVLFIIIYSYSSVTSKVYSESSVISKVEEGCFTNADSGEIRTTSVKEDEDTAIRSRHPVCFSENMFSESEEDGLNNELNYTDVLKYSLLGKNVTNSVRYNHLCPWMLPRYNCGKSKKQSKKQAYGESPVDWKLTLHNGSEQCILWDLIHDLGGPLESERG